MQPQLTQAAKRNGRKKWRTEAKLHFLTYPQCDVPLEEMVKQLKEKAGDKYGWIVISAEDHESKEGDENVGVHRHVMQEYCEKPYITDPAYWHIKWDGKVYKTHYEAVKNKTKCLKYVIKDGNYIVDGEYKGSPFSVEAYLKSTETKKGYCFEFIATELKTGKTIKEINEMAPGFVCNHLAKLTNYKLQLQEWEMQSKVMPCFYGFEDVEDPAWQQVVEWANLNFLKPREPRQDQLWLWGKNFGIGKSYPWLQILNNYFKMYIWESGQKQSMDFSPENVDYIVLDEFKGQVTVTQLKTISQMYPFKVDRKYGGHVIFGGKKNVPLIVTSNFSPEDAYPNVGKTDIDSLVDRFLVVEVKQKCFLKAKPEPVLSVVLPVVDLVQDEIQVVQQVQEDNDITPPWDPNMGVVFDPDAYKCGEELNSLLVDSQESTAELPNNENVPQPQPVAEEEEDQSSGLGSDIDSEDSEYTKMEKFQNQKKRENSLGKISKSSKKKQKKN